MGGGDTAAAIDSGSDAEGTARPGADVAITTTSSLIATGGTVGVMGTKEASWASERRSDNATEEGTAMVDPLGTVSTDPPTACAADVVGVTMTGTVGGVAPSKGRLG